jgi:ABC-2 type transport system ATP-binding protein
LDRDVVSDGTAIRQRVGYMPEHDCLPPDVSATDFVVHMARMCGLPVTAARERTADILRHVGLYEERYRPIGGYSTGMRQRVKLAQALVHDPELLLLDEPTNGLDVAGSRAVRDLVRELKAEGRCVILCSHVMAEVEALCDRLVVLSQGRVAAEGAPAELRRRTGAAALEDAFLVAVGRP